uniref:Mitochondrial ribosomal protein S21 n=1 Tax=Seriola dumerili TaxID=41447 RepID=A0A3B4V6F1_SERDU
RQQHHKPDPSFETISPVRTHRKYIQAQTSSSGPSTSARFLTQEGIIEVVKRKRYFEKPCRERQRKNFENCRRIYHMEMARKIAFISKTSREDPWLGC